MKQLNQLIIIEAGDTLPSFSSSFKNLLAAFSVEPVVSRPLADALSRGSIPSASLLILHTNLTVTYQLEQFIALHSLHPLTSIIIVSNEQDEELSLLALEAGAENCIKEDELTTAFMRRAVLLSLQRNRVEKELVQSREQLLACLENTPNVAVQWYNSKGEVLFWNSASERIFGWPAKEAFGKNIKELILIPDDKEFWLHKIQHLITNPTTTETREWKFTYRDGREGWCISTLMTIPSFEKEPWVVCMDVEITDCKIIEMEAKKNELKYRTLIEQQADAIVIFKDGGEILDVNSSAATLLQYSKEEFMQMHIPDVLLNEDLHQQLISSRDLAKGHATIKQGKMRRKDGSVLEAEVHTKHLWDGQFLASVRDITERAEAQYRLQKEIELSHSIINSLPGLFYIFTRNGNYLRWNLQQEIISEYSADEISHMGPLDFFDEDEKGIIQEAIDKTFNNGQAFVEANLFTKSGKKIPFYFTGIAIKYADTACLLGTGIDLSAIKNLEKELAQQKIAGQKKTMQAMIEASEKEKANLGLELHDNVNQILSVVKMYLSILSSNQALEGVTLEQTMELLNKAIDEIRDLSHSLAVSYKFEAGLVEALEELVDKIKLTRDFSIQMSIPQGLDDYINKNQKLAIYRIVQEQMSNIIKYAKATEVEVKIDVKSNELLLLVTDNGKGFNPATTQKGLGLNNITNRTEALEGKVIIQSKPGKGCKIQVSIPLAG